MAAALAIALTLLGLGWSGTMVAGSTLLSESVPDGLRTSAQGLSDLTMGLAAASAAAIAGPIVDRLGFPALAFAGALATTPLIVLTLGHNRQRARIRRPGDADLDLTSLEHEAGVPRVTESGSPS